jgi:hypothetical protein
MRAALASLPVLALALGCTTTHGVKPVGRGAVEANASLGGPITQVFGLPIPLPISSVGATVGVSDAVDVHGAFHPTGAALFTVVAGDIGVSGQFLAQDRGRPRLMSDLTLTFAGGDRDEEKGLDGAFRAFMQPSVTASWDWGKHGRSTVYTGILAFVEPGDPIAAIGGLHLGNRFGTGPRSHVDIELKWLQPWQSSEPVVPEFAAPGQMGAVSLQFGYGLRFGGAESESAPAPPVPAPKAPTAPSPEAAQ